jgi:predicted dehydrogenase
MELVAVCERDDRRRQAATASGAAAYQDVEPFLEHAMDAVILVNDFDQHAPVAIQALERGLSVLSERAACPTLSEGVALVEAAEHSSGVYMFTENYPYMPLTREMRRRYQAGDIGEVRYAEAEYLDEPADLTAMVTDRTHWRVPTPATYYCTHSLAPVAAITGARPVQVSGSGRQSFPLRMPTDGRRGGRDPYAARLRRRRLSRDGTGPGRVLRRGAVDHRHPGDALQPGRQPAGRGTRPTPPRGPPRPRG